MSGSEGDKKKNKLTMRMAPNRTDSATFSLENEDHTLGNVVRYMLMKNPKVTLAGYSIPHPSEPVMNLRVQTREDAHPAEELKKSLSDVRNMCEFMIEKFNEEMQQYEMNKALGEDTDMIL